MTKKPARELDYPEEARAMARIGDFFATMPGVRVPRPISALCSRRVLTAGYVAGEKITVVLDRNPGLCAEVLGRLLGVYLRQVLEAGLFQADPHPGNFLVTEGGDLVLLDFGCTCELDGERRRAYRELVHAFLAGNRARLRELLEQLGFATKSGNPDTLLAFAEALLKNFQRGAAQGSFSWPTQNEVLAEAGLLAEKLRKDPVVRIPAEFVMLGRVFGTLAGLFQHYRPAVDYARHVLPHLLA